MEPPFAPAHVTVPLHLGERVLGQLTDGGLHLVPGLSFDERQYVRRKARLAVLALNMDLKYYINDAADPFGRESSLPGDVMRIFRDADLIAAFRTRPQESVRRARLARPAAVPHDLEGRPGTVAEHGAVVIHRQAAQLHT